MDTDSILSFSTPLRAAERVEIAPSPVLELAYAGHFLGSPRRRVKGSELPWVRAMESAHAALLDELIGFWPERLGDRPTGFELFMIACQLGYARDPSPTRFLNDLPELPGRLLKLYEKSETGDLHQEKYAWLLGRFRELEQPETMARYQALFRRLWAALEPSWQEEGQKIVRAEGRRFQGELDDGQSVVQTLPKHFFARSETLAEQVKQFSEKGLVVVIPLYFSAGGGFALDFANNNTLYIGYGLHSESHFQKIAAQTEVLAQRLKAFSDPTRLLVLAMLCQFQVTVSDLAEHLDVRQPTISGHLKVLREAGLVEVEKKGNKAFYQVQKETVVKLVDELEDLLVIR